MDVRTTIYKLLLANLNPKAFHLRFQKAVGAFHTRPQRPRPREVLGSRSPSLGNSLLKLLKRTPKESHKGSTFRILIDSATA